MRIYIPLTAADLAAAEISPRRIYTVTPEFRSSYPDWGEENLEMATTLAAADESLRRLAEDSKSYRRLVGAGEVPAEAVVFAGAGNTAAENSAVENELGAGELRMPLAWSKIESLLVDESGWEDLVQRAIAGDEEAFLHTENIDLLWYDAAERALLYAELNK
ncbi:DUF6912 family protein [uncultured Arcanobacterium sp.]|uniref:DUF6912 family protein n=1 Tax=uncultured Arcanobacterium sp. TaxID=487520 RepID=UPI0026032A2A|nr:hypothetical protein [uncultured Arcanobacterium sp.]